MAGGPPLAPGCNQPAAKSDLHHTAPFSQGGGTNAENLIAACEHDHYSVHEGGWQVIHHDDGTVEWTSSTGHTYRVPPATYPIDGTRQPQHPGEGEDQNGHAADRRGSETGGEDQSDHTLEAGVNRDDHGGAVVLDCTDARQLAEFYRRLLGLAYRAGDEPPAIGEPDPRGQDWLVLVDPDTGSRLAFQNVAELPESIWPETGIPQMLYLDLTVETIAELEVQHARALELGARMRLDRSNDPDEPLRVYADPAGHPFCIFVASPV